MPLWQGRPTTRSRSLSRGRGEEEEANRAREALSRFHTCAYAGPGSIAGLVGRFGALPEVEYCEPRPIRRLSLVPNDPLVGTYGHDYFQYQGFEAAWDTTQGSSDVVIAIVDSGVDYTHPDLAGKLWINTGEIPDNGVDDDGNGYIDDVKGWDFWQSGPPDGQGVSDNDPTGDYSDHGTHVAGTAAAETNNAVGIAGTGFSCRYMAVKVGGTEQNPDDIAFGIEGIIYAVEQGADVINCSWGGGPYSRAEEEVIAAVTALGSLVVCSAGNEGSEERSYPAAYADALAVGSLDMPGGTLSVFSNYGTWVDVLATGNGIQSTLPGDAYGVKSGTSMSAPVVSGLAGLLMALRPSWSPQRIGGQIRGAAVNVDDANSSFLAHRLGAGRIDAEATVGSPLPWLKVLSAVLEDGSGEALFAGEEGVLEVVVRNSGSAALDLSARLGALTPGGTVLNDHADIGGLAADATTTISFAVRLEADFDVLATAEFALVVEESDGSYSDSVMVTADSVVGGTFSTSKLSMTGTSTGALGFVNALEGTGGIGFVARADTASPLSILFEGALIVDVDGTIADQAREADDLSRDFAPLSGFTVASPGAISDSDGSGRFTVRSDLNTAAVDILLETFVLDQSGVDQAVWVKYTLSNPGGHTLHNIYVGVFNDWDIGSAHGNSVARDPGTGILYLFDEEQAGLPYVSVVPMVEPSSLLAIKNAATGSGTAFGLYDGFTDAEKAASLRAGTAAVAQSQTDVSAVCASGPYTLPAAGSVVVGFLYVYGDTLAGLKAQVSAAQARQLFVPTTPGTSGPVNQAPTAEITGPSDDVVVLTDHTAELVLEAVANDDGEPSTGVLQTSWSVISGPQGTVFESSSAPATAVRFPGAGFYTLAFVADDGMIDAQDQVLVVVDPTGTFAVDGLAHWSFESLLGGEVPDSSGNGRDALVSGGFSLVAQGHTGSAADVNGTTGAAAFAAPAVDAFTICAWVNPRSAGNSIFPRVVDMPAYTLYLGRDAQVPDTNDTLRLHVDDGETGGVWATSENTVPDQGWCHVAVSFDTATADGEPSFFINGVQTAAERISPITGTIVTNQGTGYIGNNAESTRAWDGLLDDVRVYGSILSPDRVRVLHALSTLNVGPSVEAGPDFGVEIPAAASLSAVVSDDGLPASPGAVSIHWTQRSGPGTVVFSPVDQTVSQATFSAPGTYVLGVTADDGAIAVRDEVTATVLFTPELGFSGAETRVSESQGSVSATAFLSGATDRQVEATIQVSGSATGGGVDVTLAATSIVFAPGETTATVSLSIIDDSDTWEGEESFFLTLADPLNATIEDGTHDVVIVDNDESFEITVTRGGQAEQTLTFGAVTGATNQGTDSFDVLMDSGRGGRAWPSPVVLSLIPEQRNFSAHTATIGGRHTRGTPIFFREPAILDGAARFLTADIRALHELQRWRLVAEDAVELSWDFSQLPILAGRQMLLQLLEDERPLGAPIDMLAATSATVTGPGEFSLVYGAADTAVGVALQAGWNFAGIPLLTTARFTDLFPGPPHTPTILAIWSYRNGTYLKGRPLDRPNPEWAYWIYAAETGASLPFSGLPPDGILRLQTKWEGVSPPVSVDGADLGDASDAIWRWDPAGNVYRSAVDDLLVPGAAYWIRTPVAGHVLDLAPAGRGH
ncbi:MAG: S8 family serine peptidase [Lentisphaerae bacterium]|nr:S8 family serine peptidase [Lentisphaerota bacterium]MBT5609911.1 S8 family serine peptidase [Lentisphaerota bacterium]MBT7844580.1 S8 family serine peptidase [Lentisphaerota bacterium]